MILLATDFDADTLASWRALLGQALPDETFVVDRTDGLDESIDIALVASPPAGALRGLKRLMLIQSMWAGVDRLLADETVPIDVPIARMVDPAMSIAMAETALWAVLGLHRDLFDYAAQQRVSMWKPLPQQRADDISVAVLGLGEMGRTAALRLAANGYRVAAWSTREASMPAVRTSHGDAALAQLLTETDVVVNLLPLTPRTEGFFDARRIAGMKHGASLVNLARGAHVVDADLLSALDAGRLRHAVLDVFATEPLPTGHPFWTHPKVTVLPHVAAQTDLRSATEVAVRNVLACRAGRPVSHRVDRCRGY